MGLGAENTVYSVVEDEDGLIIISYKNGIIRVHYKDSNNISWGSTKDVGNVIDKYYGEDFWGNKYFGNSEQAVMISPDYEVVASIEDMVGLSLDGTGIVMQTHDEQRHPVLLKYEVYGKSELIEMAEYKMDYYNIRWGE